MQDTLLATVKQHAPSWVRYVLTISEIGRTNEGWVLASGDDIAIMDAGGASAMPLWPYRELAEIASHTEGERESTAPEPTSVDANELVDTILPALESNCVGVAAFPGSGGNRVIVAPGVIRDLKAFITEPRNVAAELVAEPRAVELEGWTNLSVPDLGAEVDEADARFWLLVAEDGASVIGVLVDDGPALALFASKTTAEEFAQEVEVAATPRPASTNSLIRNWLLMSFSAMWDVAIIADDRSSGVVKPVRLALDLARDARRVEEG